MVRYNLAPAAAREPKCSNVSKIQVFISVENISRMICYHAYLQFYIYVVDFYHYALQIVNILLILAQPSTKNK